MSPRTEPELQAVLGGGSRSSSSPTRSPRRRGLDVDKPRNLAKTVTVE